MEGPGFLPPEPPGPEPELGGRPAPAHPQAPAQQTYGYPPPQQQSPQQQSPQQPQPQQQPPQWGPPPGAHGQGWAPPPAWGYPQAPVPDNGSAVAGFVLSVVSGGLLFVSGGLSTVVSLTCAILGIVYSRKGRQRVERGETPKHGSLAQAGYIVGWVSLVLSVLATIVWVVVLIVAINEPSTFDDSQTIRALRSLGG